MNTGIRPKWLRTAMREFFQNNPDEELTQQDMAIKWGVHPRTIRNIISALKGEGMVKRVIVYRLNNEDM